MSVTVNSISLTILNSSASIVLGGGTVSVGGNDFPVSDGISRSSASFGPSSVFMPKSTRQLVTTSTATIALGINIIGVNFNGPVVLTLEDGEASLSEIHIVDEGGFCDPTNTISMLSTGGTPSGNLLLTVPYGYIKARSDGVGWFSEITSDVTVLNGDGSSTITSQDGTVTEVPA